MNWVTLEGKFSLTSAPCQPSSIKVPPFGTDWLHEIKHDGYRLMVQRVGGRVRLFTRKGSVIS